VDILTKNRKILEGIVIRLLEKETMEAAEIKQIIEDFGIVG